MLLALLLLVQTPVTVRLNHDQFTAGDHARVYVESAQDGYLVVLHADAEGRIRVLFPLDPTDDDFIRGGKKFEVRGRSDRDAFQIESNVGSGTVLAAVSPDAFKFDDYIRNDHWDFRALGAPSGAVRDDPLARLLDIVQKMSGDSTGGSRFDYDYATYVVTSRDIASRYGYGWRHGLYQPFYDPFCADPFYGWSASCYMFGFGVGFRGGYGYGFGYPIYRPYRPHRPYIFTGVPGPKFVIPNRPTRYTPIQPRPRSDVGGGFSNPGRGVEPRPRDMGRPNVAPRAQPRGFSGGRPSMPRGSGGGARPAPRAGGGGGGGGGGGRRH
jgi:uncharacterized protein DUF4384